MGVEVRGHEGDKVEGSLSGGGGEGARGGQGGEGGGEFEWGWR